MAVADPPVPRLLERGEALVARTAIVGFEAVEVLASSPPLRRALARHGRDAIAAMPEVEPVAEVILEAMVLAARAPETATA